MRISVVTVALDSGRTIAEALGSVAAQTHPDVEQIVVDGGSTDRTLEIAASFGSRIAKLVSEPDDGIYDAMNKGLRLATGEVVGFLNADDRYAHDRVLERVAAGLAASGADSIYGDLQYVSGAGGERVLRQWRAGAYRPGKLRRGWMPPHPALFVRRAIYDRVGGFDTSFRIAADYDMALRLFGRHRLSTTYLPEVLVRMRVGGASNRSLVEIVRKSAEDYRALRKNGVGGLLTLWCKNARKVGQLALPTG